MAKEEPAEPGQLVLVTWLDAHAETGWANIKEVKTKPPKVLSIGWVVSHTAEALVLAADVDPKGLALKKDCNRTLLIPQGMVQDIHVVTMEET